MSGTTSRRMVVTGMAAGGMALPLLTACGSSSPTSSGSNGSQSGGITTGTTLAKTADIPVGGGVVISSAKVVLTQPTAGQFKAFTAVCTHQGCLVDQVTSGQIQCPCHGSAYSAADGSVISGPANRPLAAESITVQNGSILLG